MRDKIFTDCDGVLLHWEDAFLEWMTYKGMPKLKSFDKDCYDLSVHYGIPKPRIKELISEFNTSAAIGLLKPFRDAWEIVPLLAHTHDFIVVTSVTEDRYAEAARAQNLYHVFGDVVTELYCLDVGSDKKEKLQELADIHGTGHLWIEDKLENALHGEEVGFKSILMKHNHNRNIPEGSNVKHVNDWFDIYKMVKYTNT